MEVEPASTGGSPRRGELGCTIAELRQQVNCFPNIFFAPPTFVGMTYRPAAYNNPEIRRIAWGVFFGLWAFVLSAGAIALALLQIAASRTSLG